MTKTEIDNLIRSGTPLLAVESRYPTPPPWKIVLIYILSSIPAVALATFGVVCGAPLAASFLLFIMGGVVILFAHEFLKEASERNLGMIVTSDGVSISPSCCALWEEIKAWNFRSYSGLGHFPSQNTDRVSLSLFVDDLNIYHGQFSAGRAGSAFAARGYFLDEKQQEQWTQICSERNIPRCK